MVDMVEAPYGAPLPRTGRVPAPPMVDMVDMVERPWSTRSPPYGRRTAVGRRPYAAAPVTA